MGLTHIQVTVAVLPLAAGRQRTSCPLDQMCCSYSRGRYMTGHQCSFAHRLFPASTVEKYSLGIHARMTCCFKVQSRDHYAGVSTRVYLWHHMQSTNTPSSQASTQILSRSRFSPRLRDKIWAEAWGRGYTDTSHTRRMHYIVRRTKASLTHAST